MKIMLSMVHKLRYCNLHYIDKKNFTYNNPEVYFCYKVKYYNYLT